MTTLEQARNYVKRGFSVIPLRPRDKRPAIRSWKEYKRRLPTDAELQKWFGPGSNFNIGIITGAISGIAVIDADSKEAVDYVQTCCPNAPTVKTARGAQFYFKHRDGVRCKRTDLHGGIDLKGDGGYVVSPPSIHPSGEQYTWIEGKGLDEVDLPDLPDLFFNLFKNTPAKLPVQVLKKGVPEGLRNDSLTRIVGSEFGKGKNYEEVLETALKWNEKNCPSLPYSEVRKTVDSIYMREDAKRQGEMDNTELEQDRDLELLPETPFPLEAFPSLFRNIVLKFSEAIQVQKEAIAALMIAIIGGIVGNYARVSPKRGWEVMFHVWLGIVAPTGAKKSPVFRIMLEPIKKKQAELFAQLKKKKEAANEKGANRVSLDEVEHLIVNDTTTEALINAFESAPGGPINHNDELAGFITGMGQYKSKGGNDKQMYLTIFDGDPLKRDRVGSGTQNIQKTGVSILGGIQPEIFRKNFNEESVLEGLVPRFIFSHINENDDVAKLNDAEIAEQDLKNWEDFINWGYEHRKMDDPCSILKLNREAFETWKILHDHYNAEIRPYLSPLARAFIPKLITYSLKFMGILHFMKGYASGVSGLNGLAPEIDKETVQDAIKVTRFFAGQAMRTLQLYCEKKKGLPELYKKLLLTLCSLEEEVLKGKLAISIITEVLNGSVPDQLRQTPKGVGAMLRKLGFNSEKGDGGLYFMLWEPEKLKNLCLENNVREVREVLTDKNSKQEGGQTYV